MKTNRLVRPDQIVSVFLMLMLLVFIQGCRYYKVQTLKTVTPKDMKKFDSLHKYIIVHQGASAWHLTNLGYNNEQVSGHLAMLPEEHLKYQTTDTKSSNKYEKSDMHNGANVLSEVHLYIGNITVPVFAEGDSVQIAYSSFARGEVYRKDNSTTAVAVAVPLALAGVTLIVAAVVHVATTKSSCPLVYIKRDSSFTFSGEIFGGAIYSSLERHDWLPLPGFEPEKNRYELKVTNALPEIQYINLAELWIVNHPGNVTVLPDRRGVVHTICKPELPASAVSSSKTDILTLIGLKDRSCFQFDEAPALTGDTCAFNAAFLTFAVPESAESGKLVISAGNSMWGDYAFGELTKLFGNRYEEFIAWQGKRSPEKTRQWQKDQRYPLMVYLETAHGWKFVDYFDLIGPLGAREMVMPVDLSDALLTNTAENGKSVRIKLESGFKFWDLDYAALDFSKDQAFQVDVVQPASAITETGRDVAQLLSRSDSGYYVQEKTGEEGLIVYKESPLIPGMKKSVFLHTKGYYTHVRNYPNPPDKQELQTFLVPGRFSRFSFDKHTEFVKNKMVFASDPRLP